MAKARRTVEVRLDGRCPLRCALCDCREPPLDAQKLEELVTRGGERLTLRNALGGSLLPVATALARKNGFGQIAVRTSGVELAEPRVAERLRGLGVTEVIVPFFSQRSDVHDGVTRRPGSLARALAGIRSAASAGLLVTGEIALLGEGHQNLEELGALLARAVPELHALRFHLPVVDLPEKLAAPDWSRGGARLGRAVEQALERGVRVALREQDHVPFCALAGQPELAARVFRFDPRGRARAGAPAPCASCALVRQCPGVLPSYAALHGSAGLVPFARRPKALFAAQRTTLARAWTDETRKAAGQVGLRVLRPTVNCNQDCVFCSANETSSNVWEDPDRMLRAIARAARTGVYQLSFGGGEPTLSKHLVEFVAAAERLGIRDIELVTNAVLLAKESKAQALRAAGLDRAFVSLHAHDEELSRAVTLKAGDFEKTVRGIHNLLAAGVIVRLNHVISSLNYRYLEPFVEFVAREFGGRVSVSFAFVTPQFRALENLELVPRLSWVMPYLARALYRALELGVTFVVGSRQGIPPCFLREFVAWSDVFLLAAEATVEDSYQKEKAPACASCRYSDSCTGLWKPYVKRYGFDEIAPVPGDKVAAEDVKPSDVRPESPRSFDEAPELLRDRAREALGIAGWPALDAAPPVPRVARSRPLRAVLAGTGARAHHLFAASLSVPGLTFDAVASPHAPAADPARFGFRPAYAAAEEAIAELDPECLVIAAATLAHAPLLELALAHELPALVEKPVGGSSEAVRQLAARVPAELVLMPAHQVLFAPGLERLLDAGPHAELRCRRSVRAGQPDLPVTWNRKALFESLYHHAVLLGAACGGELRSARVRVATGAAKPQKLVFALEFAGGSAELALEADAADDELVLETAESVWARRGGAVTLSERGRPVSLGAGAGESAALLQHFAAAVLDPRAPRRAQLIDAANAIDAANRLLDALEAYGVEFARPNAPRHAASKGLRPSYS
ncbi:MAG TPA: radical SAM protein [Polyangiaceae bacterium]